MSSEQFEISHSNLASCLTDSWLIDMVQLPENMEVDEINLKGVPDIITVELKLKEVAN